MHNTHPTLASASSLSRRATHDRLTGIPLEHEIPAPLTTTTFFAFATRKLTSASALRALTFGESDAKQSASGRRVMGMAGGRGRGGGVGGEGGDGMGRRREEGGEGACTGCRGRPEQTIGVGGKVGEVRGNSEGDKSTKVGSDKSTEEMR